MVFLGDLPFSPHLTTISEIILTGRKSKKTKSFCLAPLERVMNVVKGIQSYFVAFDTFSVLRFPYFILLFHNKSEPRHDKTNKMSVRSAKSQISLGIRPV